MLECFVYVCVYDVCVLMIILRYTYMFINIFARSYNKYQVQH